MKNFFSTIKADIIFIIIITAFTLLIASCSSATEKRTKTARPSGAVAVAETDFDPLHDPRDREVFETESAQKPEIKTDAQPDDFNWAKVDSFMRAQNLVDSTLTVYRVQLFASQYFTEANYELQMAQDVFSDSVFIKYDLPYYKVLLGNTTSHNKGRRLLYNARSLGYYNSWLIETPADSIFYRILYVQDSITALDTLSQSGQEEPKEEPEQ